MIKIFSYIVGGIKVYNKILFCQQIKCSGDIVNIIYWLLTLLRLNEKCIITMT